MAMAVTLMACEQPLDPSLVPDRILVITPQEAESQLGQPTEPIQFRVVNKADRGIAGVIVNFRVITGEGTVSTPSLGTDSTGLVSVTYSPVSYGAHQLDVMVEGRALVASWETWVRFPLTLRLEPNPIQLDLAGRLSMISAYIEDLNTGPGRKLGIYPEFTLTDSTVAELCTARVSGSYRGVSRDVYSLRAGRTGIIARYMEAVDTAWVVVGGPPEHVIDGEGKCFY